MIYRNIEQYSEGDISEVLALNFEDGLSSLVMRELGSWSLVSVSFWVMVFLTVGYFFWHALMFCFFDGDFSTFLAFALGLILAVVAIPLHEYLHMIAYRCLGASHASVTWDLSRGQCYTSADRFVVTGRELLMILLSPFVSILLIGIVLLVSNLQILPYFMGCTFMHLLISSGDFAIVSVLYRWRSSQVIGYDDLSAGKMYLFAVRS